MAETMVAPVMERVIGKAVDLIANEIIITSKVGDAIKRLFGVLESIRAVDQVAEKRDDHDRNRLINNWLDRLNDVAYDAEDILDLVATKANEVRNPITSCVSDVLFDRRIAHKINDLLATLKTFNDQREMFRLGDPEPVVTGRQAYLSNRETGSLMSGSEVVVRVTLKDNIITTLLAPANRLVVIPIIGMGGVGKTTLAQLIYNDNRISGAGRQNDHFSISMWVHVGQNFSVTGILTELMNYIPDNIKDKDHLSLNQLQVKVGGFLQKKRFFLVLDDVWDANPTVWNSLKAVLKQGEPGSVVLVTSRNMVVGNMTVDSESRIQNLEMLNPDESWELFCKCAFGTDGEVPDGLEEIETQIIEICGGSPLAINALGKLVFRKKESMDWMRVFRNDISVLEQTGQVTVLQVLKLSFDDLPYFLKPCFLLLSIFPKGHSFEKIELVKIWIAEGYIQLGHPSGNLEDVGNIYFDELCYRSFFYASGVSGDHLYRMHDLHHDLAVSISGTKYTQVEETLNNIHQNSRHISILCDNIEKPTLDLTKKCRKVRTILLPGENFRNFGKTPDEENHKEIHKKQLLDKKILNDLFHTLEYIRVLDLSSSSVCELPNSINKLQLLRYLDLSKTEIRMLPASICDLLNLQTLRLLRCMLLDELPKHLARVTKLRYLELDDIFWYKLSKFPAGAGKLTNLHNLNKFLVLKEEGYGIEELGSLESLTGSLHLLGLNNVGNAQDTNLIEKENLNEVVFEWDKLEDAPDVAHQESVLHNLHPHSNVKKLQIINYSGSKFPEWVTGNSLHKLTRISLNHCKNCKTLRLGNLPELKKLYLKKMHELADWTGEETDLLYLPNLKRLKIIGCPKLENLPKRLQNLLALQIKNCDSLKDLPATPSLKYLTVADNANLEEWNGEVSSQEQPPRPGFECWWGLIAAEWVKIKKSYNLKTKTKQPPLELIIKRCPKLRQLPEVHLSKLEISNCEQLRSLPPLTYPESIKHLALDTSNDGSLLSVIPQSNSLESLVLSNISRLFYLNRLPLPLLPGLRVVYIDGCNDLKHLWKGEGKLHSVTPALKFLSIKNCPKLKELPQSGLPEQLECLVVKSCSVLKNLGTGVTLKSLVSLKDLHIEKCDSLEISPEIDFPSSLKHLKIVGCEKIAKRYKEDRNRDPNWPKIDGEVIPDREINFDQESSSSINESTSRFKYFRSYCRCK